MSSQVFYRKWRPQTLTELVSQQQVTQTLLNALKSGNIAHAYLFCGPRGTGKTSTARILAKAVNCLNNNGRGEPCNTCEMCLAITQGRALDIIEIDAASNRSIDDIRDLREKVNYAPSQARRKVYIIDEFHMLSKDASNALLKTLEEPPPHVIFVLATTEAHKVLPTILSRCQHFDFHRLSRVDMVAKLVQVCSAENIKIEPQSLNLIARSSTGSMRDAYNLLEQLTGYYGADIKFSHLQAMLGITGDWRTREIVKHVINNDITGGMSALNSVNSDGLDLLHFTRELVEYLRELLLVKTGASESIDLTTEDVAELKELADKASLSQILNAVRLFGQIQMGNNDSSTLPLELALVECYLSQEKKTSGQEKPGYPVQSAAKTAVPPAISRRPDSPETKILKADKDTTISKVEPELKSEKVTMSDPIAVSEPRIDLPPVASIPKETPPAVPTLTSEIERLKLNWKQILDEAPPNIRRSAAISWLRGGKPVSIEGEIVMLSFGFEIHKTNVEKPENLRIVEKVFTDYLGHNCKVVCVLDAKKDHLVNLAKKMGAQVTSVEEK